MDDRPTGASNPQVGDTLEDGTTVAVSPPVVYLPCAVDDEGNLTEIKMVQLRDGRVALMAYSALDRLARACGDEHPWVLWETARLEDLREIKAYDAAYLDVALPVEMRLGGEPRGA